MYIHPGISQFKESTGKMRFSAPEEYGLRCMLQMARLDSGGAMTINELASKELLTPAYIAKLMRLLRQANLVESTRGQKGGYLLARPAGQISVGDVINALGGPLHSEEHCNRYSGNARRCVHSMDCAVKSLWSSVDKLVGNVLSQCKLTDLIQDKSHIEQWVNDHLNESLTGIGISTGCGSGKKSDST